MRFQIIGAQFKNIMQSDLFSIEKIINEIGIITISAKTIIQKKIVHINSNEQEPFKLVVILSNKRKSSKRKLLDNLIINRLNMGKKFNVKRTFMNFKVSELD